MNISYLIDTSALRALSTKAIQNIFDQYTHLFVSPYCFWELLCHLDEEKKFDYYKTQLLKFKYVKVLDDPDAVFYTSFLPNDPTLQERVSDDDLIYPMVSVLHSSDSLKTFYSQSVRAFNGKRRQIADCATRTREVLAQGDTRYIYFIHKIMKIFQSGELDIETDKPYSYHQRILEFVEGGDVWRLQEKGVSENGLREKVIVHSYIYWSYLFHRALHYFRKGKIRIDPHDFEDSMICRHLTLRTPYCLVTADKEMKVALEETISLLKRLNKPQFYTTLRVKNMEDIQNLNNYST